MADFDYSLHYRRFHDNSEKHAEETAAWQQLMLAPHAPADREAPILDIGCGFGFALRALRNLGFKKLTGLEMSPQQAGYCREAGFNVEVTGNTAAWLRSHPGQFAFVVLLDVLEHVPVEEQIDFTRAIHEALQPGGKVFMTVPNASAIIASRWRHLDHTHHTCFTEHSLHFVFLNAGFKSLDVEAEKGIGRFPRSVWKRTEWPAIRKWIIRWCWLQVHESELFFDPKGIKQISFELNLRAVATKA